MIATTARAEPSAPKLSAAEIERAAARLAAWCRARDFAGYDPYDGLNSSLFRSTPLNRSPLARLAWTQLFKRSPFNLRSLAGISAERNPKGTALFALAALARFRRTEDRQAANEARLLLNDLAQTRLISEKVGANGAAWGYNFDWQGRAFFAPRGTPTAVPTAFVARAHLDSWRTLGDETHLDMARRVCSFIIEKLPRSVEIDDELCFAYSPHDRTRVFNASLLAAETLAGVAIETCEEKLCDLAMRAARYVTRRQQPDGRWAYGADDYQSWADNFHTAFLLASLLRIEACAHRFGRNADEIKVSIELGNRYWQSNFFTHEGAPKYYPEHAYPFDAHSAGAALATFAELRARDSGALTLAAQVASWATRHLQDSSGYFYYQQRRLHTVRIPYMRWSQAWMLYGLERLSEEAMNDERGTMN